MIVRKDSAPVENGGEEGAGPRSRRRISDAGGLTQFGAHLETLMPGSVSSDRRPCTYLIVGARVAQGAIHYPDLGRICYFEGKRWRVV